MQKKEEQQKYYTNRPVLEGKGPSRFKVSFQRGMTMFVVIATCIAFYFAILRLDKLSQILFSIFDVLQPILYGFIIAYLLNPMVKFVEKYATSFLERFFPNLKKKAAFSRGVGIGTAIVVLLIAIVALCNLLLPELFSNIYEMAKILPEQINLWSDKITAMLSGDTTLDHFFTEVLERATESLKNWLQTDLLNNVNTWMTSLTKGMVNVINGLFNLVLGLIVSAYLLSSKEKFLQQSKKAVYALFSPPHANILMHLAVKSDEIFGGYMVGTVVDSIIVGVLCFLGMSIFHMPYALLVSVIVGVTNIIPFFGPYIGAIPSALLILLTDPKTGIYFIIFILVLQQIDGNIVAPKILGNSLGLSAFWIIFAILLGGGLFGFAGMLLGVPAFGLLYYIVDMLLDYKLEKKRLPTQAKFYGKASYVDFQGQYVAGEVSEREETESGETTVEQEKETKHER